MPVWQLTGMHRKLETPRADRAIAKARHGAAQVVSLEFDGVTDSVLLNVNHDHAATFDAYRPR